MGAMHFDWDGISYFGAKVGRVDLFGERVVIAQAFRREFNDATVAGVSLLQVGKRHLLYIGSENGAAKLCVGFLWITAPHS